MIHAVAEFCDWLAATSVSQVIQKVVWFIPMVQSLHILAVSIVMGSVIMIDTKLLGWTGVGSTVSDQLRRYTPWIWGALIVLLCTGTILTTAEPRRELLNPVFITKMALIVVIVLSSLAFLGVVRRQAVAWGEAPSSQIPAKLLAITSLLGWVAVVVCGRWIAYVSNG